MPFSHYLSEAILNHVLRNTAHTSPATVYLSLATSLGSAGSIFVEPSTGGYARQAIAFGAPSGRTVLNSGSTVSFPAPTTPWGPITHVGVHDAVSAGNLLFYKLLNASITTATSMVVQVEVGSLSIAIDP